MCCALFNDVFMWVSSPLAVLSISCRKRRLPGRSIRLLDPLFQQDEHFCDMHQLQSAGEGDLCESCVSVMAAVAGVTDCEE